MEIKNHKAGFVTIIGRPNAGKSTFLNAILDYKLSIVTPKAQTTRHRILGMYNDENTQIIFSDTPGIVKDPAYKLHEKMLDQVSQSFEGTDVIILIQSAEDNEVPEEVQNFLDKSKKPLIVLLNKIDFFDQEKTEKIANDLSAKYGFETVLPISALNKFGVAEAIRLINKALPSSPPFYPKDQLTDRPEKFFAAEIIREKIFMRYKEEVPYATSVVVDLYKDKPKIVHIMASIIVERQSQKGIMIGEKGIALKNMATAARISLENFIGKKVFLEVFVKVEKDWKNNDNRLKEYGY